MASTNQPAGEHVRRVDLRGITDEQLGPLLSREWLLTNGLGGYASGTVLGAPTRRYHGLLVAALPEPYGRVMMLSQLYERVRLPGGKVVQLGGEERVGAGLELPGAELLVEFRLESGLPVWRYAIDGVTLEKRIVMPHEQNTVHVTYTVLTGPDTLRLKLMPTVNFRLHEAHVGTPLPPRFTLTSCEGRHEISAEGAGPGPLRMLLHGQRGAFTVEERRLPELLFRVEESRGYESRGELWSPGYFRVDLEVGEPATLVASTEAWRTISALRPDEALAAERGRRRRLVALADPRAQAGAAAELVLAADQFIIRPAGRVEEDARAHAAGHEARTVIAGYHWFTDWGRDTMISLEGLTLVTGRHAEASHILSTFARHIRDGLVPNLFPEGEKDGLYHTADATLWFFHALARHLAVTGDRSLLRSLLPKLREIVEHHLAGLRFGIGVDPEDGLLRQGEEGYQLTWMDAKVGDWVVTPRRGKAVEINALWYNALRLLAEWTREEGDAAGAAALEGHAARARASFNARFWYEQGGHLYDVIDGERGDDPACRPNQVFAISLAHPVLERARWDAVLAVVRDRLLTPVGLRSLAPGHPDYKARYFGDLRARDAAYHQGTVWAWLIGPFVDAWLKAHPDDLAGARRMLEGFEAHLEEACVGSISEVFDAEAPFTPRACIAQAWSVAELLRCWVKTAG